jgi:hypothetical protein
MDPGGYGGTSFQTPGWTIRAKSVLAEFSDFFSDFGRYIAPSYRHDRCERQVNRSFVFTIHLMIIAVESAWIKCALIEKHINLRSIFVYNRLGL